MFRINFFLSGVTLMTGIYNFIIGEPLWGALMIVLMFGNLVIGEWDYQDRYYKRIQRIIKNYSEKDRWLKWYTNYSILV